MTEATNKMVVTLPSDTEITITRMFNAPRRLVFEAHTKPEHVRNWWGPHGTELTVCEIDLRVGGAWRFVMIHDGQEVAFNGVYQEIASPERLVNTEIFEMFPDNISVVTMVLTEEDGKTRLTSISVYESKEVRDIVVESGMEGGAAESYDRMEALLGSMS